MLSFGLDTGFESFATLVNGLVHNRLFQVSPDLNKSALVAMKTMQLVLGPYQTFQAQWVCNWMAVHHVKNHLCELILINLCRPALGVRFFMKHSAVRQIPDNDLLEQTTLYNLLYSASCTRSCSRYVWHLLHGNSNLHSVHSSALYISGMRHTIQKNDKKLTTV